MLKHHTLALEVRSVDGEQRIIEGYANVFGIKDAYGTRWTPKTFERTLREDGDKVRVFEGHDVRHLPVGKPLEMRIDGTGLFTRTLIAPGPDGDNLLAKARFFQEQGSPIGLSVGFTEIASHRDGDVIEFDDVTLREYSFVAFEAVPGSLVTAVRAEGEPLDPHEIIGNAITQLVATREAVELRALAARALGDDVAKRAVGTPALREALEAVRATLLTVLEAAAPEPTPPADDTPPDFDAKARAELERFLGTTPTTEGAPSA